MNLGEFRTAVNRRTGIAYDDTALNELVNMVLNDIAMEDDWPWLQATASLSQSAGTSSILAASLPTTARSFKSIIDTTNGVVYDPTTIADVDGANSWYGTPPAQFGTGSFFAVLGMDIYLTPAMPAAGTLTIRYIQNEPTLSADGSSPLLPVGYHHAVVDLVAYLVAGRRSGPDDGKRAGQYSEMYRRLIGDMKKTARRRISSTRMPRIRPGSGW